jgi:hypothetical protein
MSNHANESARKSLLLFTAAFEAGFTLEMGSGSRRFLHLAVFPGYQLTLTNLQGELPADWDDARVCLTAVGAEGDELFGEKVSHEMDLLCAIEASKAMIGEAEADLAADRERENAPAPAVLRPFTEEDRKRFQYIESSEPEIGQSPVALVVLDGDRVEFHPVGADHMYECRFESEVQAKAVACALAQSTWPKVLAQACKLSRVG